MLCSHLSYRKTSRFFSKGFSLTELMVATSIVGILSSVAVPAMKRYIYDARMAEAVRIVGDVRREQEGVFARSQATDQVPFSDRFTSSTGKIAGITYRINSNRFNVIVGNAQVRSVIGPNDRIALSEFPDNPLNVKDDMFVNFKSNGYGPFVGAPSGGASVENLERVQDRNGRPSYRFAVVGSVMNVSNGPDGVNATAFFSTRTYPAMLMCNEESGAMTPEFIGLGPDTAGPEVEGLEQPNCVLPTGSGSCSGFDC